MTGEREHLRVHSHDSDGSERGADGPSNGSLKAGFAIGGGAREVVKVQARPHDGEEENKGANQLAHHGSKPHFPVSHIHAQASSHMHEGCSRHRHRPARIAGFSRA